MNWREARIIGFDVETTGLDPVKDRIVQLAFTIYDPGRDAFGPEYERLCGSDGVELRSDVSSIHGILPEDIAGRPPADSFMEELLSFLSDFREEDYLFLAYNGGFDAAFLLQACRRSYQPYPIDDPLRVLDPLTFARSRWDHNRLPELAANLGVPSGGTHEACKDVRLTIQCMHKIGELLKLPDDFDTLLAEQEKCIKWWEKETSHKYRDTLYKVWP